jgi:uncharacterized protein
MQTVGRGSAKEGDGGRWDAKRVFIVIAGALLIAVFLNAVELEAEAKRKPLGGERDFWVAVWKPFATVSRALYLDQPRAWADEAIGRGEDGPLFQLPSGSPTPTAPPDAEATATPALPAHSLRTPTEDEPLRLWVGGDSMSKVLGEAVVRQAVESDLIDPTHEPQLESGLTRPDFFDWPRELDRIARKDPPYDVLVVMFGANDAQGIIEPGGKIHQDFGTPGWLAEYRRRVAGVMDLLKHDERLVVWVGQPIMRDDDLSGWMSALNEIYQQEAEKRPWVRYLDTWELFVDEDGDYAATLEDDDGEEKLMRNPDGVHFVREGGERAARYILDIVFEAAEIDRAQAPPPATTPVP